MYTMGFVPLSKVKAGHLPIALVKMHTYNLVGEHKSFLLSYSRGSSTRGVICHLGRQRERGKPRDRRLLMVGRGGSWEQGQRDPGGPGLNRSDRSKGRQQAARPKFCE